MGAFELAKAVVRDWRGSGKRAVLAKSLDRLRKDAGVGVQRMDMFKTTAPLALPAGDLRIERIDRDQLGLLEALGPSDRAGWEARLERGDRCYGAWVGRDLAHYSWVQSAGSHLIAGAGHTVQIAPGEIWIYDCRTADAHRGQRIYPRTLARIVADHFAAGAHTAWIYTRGDNTASQRGLLRAGFTASHSLRALRVGRHYRELPFNGHARATPTHPGRARH